MKCPKCDLVTFDHLPRCPSCSASFRLNRALTRRRRDPSRPIYLPVSPPPDQDTAAVEVKGSTTGPQLQDVRLPGAQQLPLVAAVPHPEVVPEPPAFASEPAIVAEPVALVPQPAAAPEPVGLESEPAGIAEPGAGVLEPAGVAEPVAGALEPAGVAEPVAGASESAVAAPVACSSESAVSAESGALVPVEHSPELEAAATTLEPAAPITPPQPPAFAATATAPDTAPSEEGHPSLGQLAAAERRRAFAAAADRGVTVSRLAPTPAADAAVDAHHRDAQSLKKRMMRASQARRRRRPDLIAEAVDPVLPGWYEPGIENPVAEPVTAGRTSD